MSIASQIKKARQKLGLSQADAAERWSIPVRTLQNWEIGRNEPRGFARTQLEKLIADILGSEPSAGRPKHR